MIKLILLIAVVLLILYLLITYTSDSETEHFNNDTSGNNNNMILQPIAQIHTVISPNSDVMLQKKIDFPSAQGINTQSLNQGINTESLNQGIHTESLNQGICTQSVKDTNVPVTQMTTNKCEIGGACGQNLYPILDPKFNMREAAKQCLLLEDHLNNTKKRCFDCIRKHFLTIDGFLEEAISLEKNNNDRNYYRHLYLNWVKIEKLYAKNPSDTNNLDNVSKNIRYFRKPLVEKYFDQVSEFVD